MIAISPKGERWYTPESETAAVKADKAKSHAEGHKPYMATAFKIRDLTQGARVRIFDALRVFVDENSSSIGTSMGSRTHLALKACLVGVRGLFDADGAEVPIEMNEEGQVADAFLERLPWAIQREVAAEILAASVMSEDEVEKPEPSPVV